MRLADPPRAEVREITEEVLDRPEFVNNKSLIQRFFDRILEWLDGLFGDSVGGAAGGWGGAITNVILWVVLFAAVVGLAILIWLVARNWVPRARREKDPDAEVVLEVFRSSAGWASEAEGHEMAGRWREAAAARYRELVARLVENGWVSEVVGRTTGELNADLGESQPQRSSPFREATEVFEEIWYGGREASAEDVMAIRSSASAVLGAGDIPATAPHAADSATASGGFR